MIDYAASLTYFRNHPHGAVWTAAGATQGAAAIAHARRTLSRALARPLDDYETTYIEGDTEREEYAVYEQALWSIENGIVAGGDGATPLPVLSSSPDSPDSARQSDRQFFAPEALRWLGYRGVTVIAG